MSATDRVARVQRIAIVVAVVGALLLMVGVVVDNRRAAASYLVAYAAVLTIALGALTLLLIGGVIRVRWLRSVRDIVERVAATIPVFALLFVPIAAWLPVLYSWVAPADTLTADVRATLDAKAAYLNVPFFAMRAVAYFGIWWLLAAMLGRTDPSGARWRTVSAVGLPVLVVTATFAAFDWLMSTAPLWYSTIYGVYVLAGGIVAALSLIALLSWIAERPASSSDGGLGTILLTGVVFWAYLGFSQLLIVWIANIPEEASWYDSRLRGGWGIVGAVLVAGHFLLPLLALLLYGVKRDARALAAIGGWLVLMHYLDMQWLVMPDVDGRMVVHWLDGAAIAAVGGATTAFGVWRLRGDVRPRSHRSAVLRYEDM